MKNATTCGADLMVGDTIQGLTPASAADTIIGFRPYEGSVLSLLGEGTRIATFARARVGLTVSPDDEFVVVARGFVPAVE